MIHSNVKDVTAQQPPAGVGLASGWRCAGDCGHVKYSSAGRKLLMVRGCKQWVCVQCVTARSAVK